MVYFLSLILFYPLYYRLKEETKWSKCYYTYLMGGVLTTCTYFLLTLLMMFFDKLLCVALKYQYLFWKETFKNSSILLHVQCILLVFFSKKLNNDILAWWKYLNDKILNIQCTSYILRDGMLKFKYFIGNDCTWI